MYHIVVRNGKRLKCRRFRYKNQLVLPDYLRVRKIKTLTTEPFMMYMYCGYVVLLSRTVVH